MCTSHRSKSLSAVALALFLILSSLPVSAGLLDKIKETTSKTLEAVKDVKDTVTTGRKIGEESRRTRDVLLYNDSIQLSRDQLYQLQVALNNTGYDAGLADGQMGQKTRNAIAAFQRDNGYHPDGSLSSQIFGAIIATANTGYQPETPLSRAEWKQFQSLLNELGFDAGTPDGKPGPRTRRAVNAFTQSRNLGPSTSERSAFESISMAGIGSSAISSGDISTDYDGGVTTPEVVANGYDPDSALQMNSSKDNAETRRQIYDALANMLLQSNPEVLDHNETLFNWFTREGGVLESEYLREETLAAFKADLLARPAQGRLLVQFEHDTWLRPGNYDKQKGVFKIGLNEMFARWEIPPVANSYFKVETRPQLPVVGNVAESVFGDSVLGIPMTLREAIDFEKEMFGANPDKRGSIRPIKLVSVLEFSRAELAPLKINESAGSFRYGKLEATLHSLSVYFVEGRRDRKLADKLHTWTLDKSASTEIAQQSSKPAVEVSKSIEDIARRYKLRIFEGHLVLDNQVGNAFAAAMALGFNPELLEDRAMVVPFAQLMLTREEKREVGLNHKSDRLDLLAKDRLIDQIQGGYKSQMLARALPRDLPVVVAAGASLKEYNHKSQRVPIRYQSIHNENGQFHISNAGSLKSIIVNRRVWLPDSIAGGPDEIKALLSANNSSRSIRVGLIGKLVSHKSVGHAQHGRRSLSLFFKIETNRLVVLKSELDEPLTEFDLASKAQQKFSRMMEVTSAQLISNAALLSRLSDQPGVDQFTTALLNSDQRIKSANEFDRQAVTEKVRKEFEEQGKSQTGAVWLTGSITLGQYNFAAGRFSLESMTLKNREDGPEKCFRRCIKHTFTGVTGISLDEQQARSLVDRYPQRTFYVRVKTEPQKAEVSGLDRPDYATITVSHRIDEIHIIGKGRSSNNRQQWNLVASNIIEPLDDESVEPTPAPAPQQESGAIVASVATPSSQPSRSSQPVVSGESAAENTVAASQAINATTSQQVTSAQDVVGVKTGMLLPEAEKIVQEHLGIQDRLMLNRGFTTSPGLFENAYFYVAPSKNEYFALFFEGNPEIARVTGVLRNVQIVGSDFPREAALGMLRSKYGAENFIKAENSLNLAWGDNVARTQRASQNTDSLSTKTRRGQCRLSFTAPIPAQLADSSGQSLKTSELFGVSASQRSRFLKWPMASGIGSGRTPCGQYLEAIHEQHEHPQVMIALFDLPAYHTALKAEAQRLISHPVDSDTKQPDSTANAPIKF